MTEKNPMQTIAQAMTLLNERIDKVEARCMASDLLILALIQTLSQESLRTVCESLEDSASPQHTALSNSPAVAAIAQARVRELLAALRRASPAT